MTEDVSERRKLPERRRGYAELKDRVDQYMWSVEKRFHRWFIIGLAAFTIIGLSTAVALAGFGVVLKNESRQNDEIQAQRRDFVRDACLSQNARNRNTKLQLKIGSDEDIRNATSEAQRTEIQRRVEVTTAIIDAVLPVQNCANRVRLATQSSKGRK